MSEQNENEMLAKWRYGLEPYEYLPDGTPISWVRFRHSNEHAGALLEKLLKEDACLESEPLGLIRVRIWDSHPMIERSAETWRDAVIDAALEVIRRESQVDEGGKHG